MSVGTFVFHSKAMGKQMHFNILLPDACEPPFATLYLLHGNGDDHYSWLTASSFSRKKIGPIAVVMPNADRGRYVNSQLGRYEDYIVEDLIGFVDRNFPTKRDRGSRAISGFSMGGYGAMMLGLKHCDVFSALSSHAGSYYNPRWVPRPGGWHEIHPGRGILSHICAEEQYDCRYLAERALQSGAPPAVRFDCGTEDPALECAQALHMHLEKIGLVHTYAECPGGHNWNYVEARLDDSLRFIHSSLGIGAK